MSLDLALGIARSGLAAVQRGLAQGAQNIANAETPGYTRKALPQQAAVVGDRPLGLRTAEAQRAVDTALAARLDASRSALAAAEARERLLAGVEQAHGTSEGGSIADALSGLRSGLLTLRVAPSDAGAQRAALEEARSLAQGLNTLSDAIGAARQEAQDGIVQEVASINATLREVAGLTRRLTSGGDGDTAALEDARDLAIARLSESIELRAVRQPGGDLLLVARGGVVLPLDPDRDALFTAGAGVSPGQWHGGAGGTLPGVLLNGLDITAQIGGGRLGEYLALRDTTLPRYQAEADIAAATAAGRFEAQGLRLFTDADGTVPATTGAYAGSAQIGFAGRIRLNPAVEANPALLRDGTHAVAGSAGGPAAFTPNPAGGPSGFTTLLDRVLDHSLGDKAAAGAPWPAIATGGLGPDGSLASPFAAPATLEGYAARLTAAQTGDRASATAAKEAAADLRTALEARFGDWSGVDVDAEMAGMVALQNAYAANARVLGTVQAMWDALLGAMR
jgi:flagellar hook-associated protein 1 FlgK